MNFSLTHCRHLLEVVIVRPCLRGCAAGCLWRCRELALAWRCSGLANRLHDEYDRRLIRHSRANDEPPEVTVAELAEEERATADLRRREAGIGGAR